MISLDGTIITDALVANSFFKKVSGYMFRKKPHYSMIYFPSNKFYSATSFQTQFCYFSLNIYLLNKNREIIGILTNINPSSFILIRSSNYNSFLEVPTESDWNNKIKMGTKLDYV